ncbi:MAG: translation initiation factor IF-2, partial [Aggregatilineales bacterium]
MVQEKNAVLLPDFMTVRELAESLEASPIDVMKTLISNGVMVSINQQIDYDTAAIVTEEMGYEAHSATIAVAEAEEQERADELTRKWEEMYAGEKPENLKERPPVITILGHVDHGKTTLLDTIRSASVADGEAGGITQHIGAYKVSHDGRSLTFLDTPGHEAFTAMRARGAEGADIAVLVVAADDAVMPTTREALNHARAAAVPIVVAITKVDKSNASPERVKQELAELELIADDWDGDTLMIPVASLKGEGIEELLEALLLITDDNEFVANAKGTPRGIVIESEMDKSRGTMATLLVMNGTLKRGDSIVAGTSYGRIKAMYDENGKQLKQADPSTPVSILGLNEPPQPGDHFERVKNDKKARQMAEARLLEIEERSKAPASVFSLEEIFQQFQAGETKELTLIIKADVQGSLQPIVDSLSELSGSNEEGIKINVLASDVGGVSENDVMLASASGAIIMAFNVNVGNAAVASADTHKVDIRSYKVIYKLLEDVELALEGMLEPKYEAKVIGHAEVRELFKISRVGVIAGSYIKDGEARRNAKARVLRNGRIIVEESGISSLKRFNEDVREVRTGFEC